ncbi:unnamed protein product, partial [Prorocentrum cordatum]
EIRTEGPTYFSRQQYTAMTIDRLLVNTPEHYLIVTDIHLSVAMGPVEMAQSRLSDLSISHASFRAKQNIPEEAQRIPEVVSTEDGYKIILDSLMNMSLGIYHIDLATNMHEPFSYVLSEQHKLRSELETNLQLKRILVKSVLVAVG